MINTVVEVPNEIKQSLGCKGNDKIVAKLSPVNE